MFRTAGKYLIAGFVTLAVPASAWFVSQARADKELPIAGRVSQLPAVQVDGGQVDLAAAEGWKVIYFWSDSCPCVKRCEQLNLIPLSKKYQGQVNFYGVATNAYNVRYRTVNQQGKELELPMLRVTGGSGFWPPYPVVLDTHHQLADKLGAGYTPEVFVLNPDNQLVYRGVPDDSKEYEERTGKPGLTENYLQEALAEALAGKKISHAEVPGKGYCGIDRSDAAAPQKARSKGASTE